MKTLCGICMFLFLVGCSSSSKVAYSSSELADFKNLIESRFYSFGAHSAHPMVSTSLNAISNAGMLPMGSTVSNIQLTKKGNYLKIEGDTVAAHLSYYGERQSGGSYGKDVGIEFKGVPEDYEAIFDSSNNEYTVRFEISEKSENYNVVLTVFPNRNARVYINSSQRNAISYTGDIEAIDTNNQDL
ncbi:DUF4251 domain-containing protein [Maribacter sp. MMG018]|uniref:DUF4251 domain-containing protein n=1 Tax=Maribacter sp. MMG018 TaxID=2822688 RepID=UPI001B37221B|nr:DUF4251 domain-containing protein [Maribacter sp. MMG018]MBQ4915002.1 DUF4251 domain-containing protein [Maribacter sp. MMG018]